MTSDLLLRLNGVAKTFTLHAQGGVTIPVFADVGFDLSPGDGLALGGPSGVGKSTLIKMIYGAAVCAAGEILIRHDGEWLDVASAHPHRVLDLRRRTLGYVSQFLRALPRVSALDVVAEPARAQGLDADAARDRARALLERLRIPSSLWPLSPLTFSGGEQQRVNLARGFCADYAVMLLDEPTASLDAENRETVLGMIADARARGVGVIGISHDANARARVFPQTFDLAAHAVAPAAA